jgi:hypothetical protein
MTLGDLSFAPGDFNFDLSLGADPLPVQAARQAGDLLIERIGRAPRIWRRKGDKFWITMARNFRPQGKTWDSTGRIVCIELFRSEKG